MAFATTLWPMTAHSAFGTARHAEKINRFVTDCAFGCANAPSRR